MARSLPLYAVGLAYALATAVGAARFIARDTPSTASPLLPSTTSDAIANLASLRASATVRASSWDWFRRHHPLYAIDGEPRPTLLEKWASAPSDRRPWIEIGLAHPSTVRRVVLVFATAVGQPVVRSYRLRCLASRREIAAVEVRGNAAMVAAHDLTCDNVEALRLEVDVSERPPSDVARVYEIEAWGPR